MTEYRSVLEQAGSSAPQPDLQVERVLRRRDRRHRNQRIGAGALGVIVTLALGTILVRSVTSEPIPADPPVVPRPAPAASGTLTYALDGDIFVADPDGSNAVKVSNGLPDNECGSDGEDYWAEGSMWSPDGRYIAYRYDDCSKGTGGVVISDAEGNVLATIPTLTGWGIAWSPDSTRVAVWDSLDYPSTIGVYGLDGARQTQLTMPTGWTPDFDHEPVWMPDGTSVWIDGWVLPVDGSTPRRLPFGGEPYPTFSPDGSLVAYNENRSLMVARSDGSGPRAVFGGGASYSAWSPTGDRIAFSDGEGLRLLDVATGEVTRLTREERGTDLQVKGFSPEGDRVLFSTSESDSSLWSIDVDGSDASLVVAGTWQGEWLSQTTGEPTTPDAQPTPAASGTLAYALDGDIFVADPDGSNAFRIENGLPEEDCFDGGEYWAEGPMWSPDGRYLAYRHNTDCSSSAPSWDVVISDAGGNVITTFPAQGWGVAWSPDSTRVAVWDRLYDPPVIDPFNDPPATIGVYGLDGSRQTQLAMPSAWTSGENSDDDPAWMADGTSLRVHNLEVPLDGSTPRQLLLPLPALRWSVSSYSPDGSRVVYAADDDLSLVVAAADGSDAREVAGRTVVEPVWSPTGDRIAFIHSEKGDRYGSSNELRVLDVATGEVTALVGMDGSWDIGSVQFSPQGDRILISRYGRGADEYGLWSIGVDGSDARLVVAGTPQGDWLSR